MAKPAELFPAKKNRDVSGSEDILDRIEKRRTDELVIGFCGALGSGITQVIDKLVNIFKNAHYEHIKIVKISKIIQAIAEQLDEELDISSLSGPERVKVLQDWGNKLRDDYQAGILALAAIQEVGINRKGISGVSHSDTEADQLEDAEPTSEADDVDQDETRPDPVQVRLITIIDSLKNPEEVKVLRTIYGEMFYLIGVLCPEEARKKRLQRTKNWDEHDAVKLMNRDADEDEKYGQQLLNTIQHSDFFIKNIKTDLTGLEMSLSRFVSLILGDIKPTPTFEEFGMYLAHSSALRSGCLSRQVGAAIFTKDGEILSTGCNDVPKANGGLYTSEDVGNDGRCLHYLEGNCRNKEEKKELVNNLSNEIAKELNLPTSQVKVRSILSSNQKIKSLIEYCRAVHAEMDAIIAAGRKGEKGIKGGTLFCTTFPCHNCAKHIVASGLKKVFYIEPYAKSLALKLHDDSITLNPEEFEGDNGKMVTFEPFTGVGPKQYINMFSAQDRKSKLKHSEDKSIAKMPKIGKLLDDYQRYEEAIIEDLAEIGPAFKSLQGKVVS